MNHLGPILIALIWVPLLAADRCSYHLTGYSSYGPPCFKLYTIPKPWTAAEASCVADGGHLASIHSSEEQDFVSNLVAQSTAIWIGISGVYPNMTWSDDTNYDFKAWEPSDAKVNGVGCGRLVSGKSFLWLDATCTISYHYICKAASIVDGTEAYFSLLPGGAPTDVAVVPSSTHTVRSVEECAVRCHKEARCVHFLLNEDSGNYLCETYSSMTRPPTAAPPTVNYQKTS